MQNEIIAPWKLLDKNGDLLIKGFAKSALIEYNRENIKAGKMRIKEWDYYYIGNSHHGLALTIADNGYMGMLSTSFLDFDKKINITKSDIIWFTLGKINLPSSTKKGDVKLKTNKGVLEFDIIENHRVLRGEYNNFIKGKNLNFEIDLSNEPKESILMVTPFNKRHHFYLNQKINCMAADGFFKIGDDVYHFDKKDSYGTLDWGRGVWTYKNTWFWGSLSTNVNDKPFGFNIGYGFGDTSAASENVIFYDGKAHKFNNINFGIPTNNKKDDFMATWHMQSDDHRLDMTFTPIMDRAVDTNVLLIRSNQHQVFGKYSGTAILDDGTKIEFKDKIGFAEKVFNKW